MCNECEFYFKELTLFENKAINFFLMLDIPFKSELVYQIQKSEIKRENMFSSYFVTFSGTEMRNKISTLVRVPISISISEGYYLFSENKDLIESFDINKYIVVTDFQSNYRILNKADDEIGINLHFLNGYVRELEIYSTFGKKINFDILYNGKRLYEICDRTYDFLKT